MNPYMLKPLSNLLIAHESRSLYMSTIKPTISKLLDQVTEKLVLALKPEKIILFGSYAYGTPTEDSDIDLLVVIANSDEPRYKRSRKAYRALRSIAFPTDIIVMTREEFQRKINVRSSLVNRAINEGQILYGL